MTVIYGASDIASKLGVSRPTVSNYLARHDDTPEPAYETPGGQRFWDARGLAKWIEWKGSK